MNFTVQLVRKPLTVSTRGDNSHDWSYRWLATLDNGHGPVEIDYWTGCGNFTGPKDTGRDLAMRIAAGLASSGRGGRYDVRFKPTEPTLTDVCYSLRLDLESVDMSFREWCDNFGYDGHPADALDTYNACVAIRDRLARAGITIDDLDQHIPEDY